MHITKIELENIKSYENAVFEFGRGTTAIMGENGAGKTSLIEAVAWTLFDLLDYKKDDFLKRGTKRGLVRVEFESGLDERRYIVQRDTRTAYFVYDPKLKTRIADKKEEVTRFLWQHLGVEAGTDLESLFRRAIGVPQGTFTAIFLETPNERKKAFDKLLKVEEYRIGAMRLVRTAKHVEQQILEIVQKIARAEGRLSNREKYEEELKTLSGSDKELTARLKLIKSRVKKERASLRKSEKLKTVYESARAEMESLVQEQKRADLVSSQKTEAFNNSKKAEEIVSETKPDHDLHKKALGMLQELERERKVREKMRTALNEVEKAIVRVKAEQRSVRAQLDEIEIKRKSVTELRPRIKEQEELEAGKRTLERSIAEAKEKNSRVAALEARLDDLRKRHLSNDKDLKSIAALKESAESAETLRQRDESITKELAALRATIERDREFKVQIEDGMCPVFSAKCLNLKAGETLDGFLSSKYSGLQSSANKLEKEKSAISKEASKAREAQAAFSRLPMLEKRRDEILADGKALREEQDKLKSDVSKMSAEEDSLKTIENRLTKLGDPKGTEKLLQKEVGRIGELREQSTKVESNLERLESDRRQKVEQLETYKDLDSNWKEFSEKRDQTAAANNKYLQNKAVAKSLAEAKAAMERAAAEAQQLAASLKKATSKLEKASSDFDPDDYKKSFDELRSSEVELAGVASDAKHASGRKKEIENEIAKLKKVKTGLEKDLVEKQRLDRLVETVSFIRNTLKAAAPRVAKNYVFHVSVEANTLYREITGNAEVTLRWTDDYGIELEEDGFSRPFISLSGGEQMSAALAVRLALLRQLSDIRLAFFDEPTTNMDLERRERLAEQISRITENQTFDQLFVISHDDTFESFADHVIEIGE